MAVKSPAKAALLAVMNNPAPDPVLAAPAATSSYVPPVAERPLPPRIRHIGTVNWIGLWALYRKEVSRFLVVYNQTLAAPLVTTLLFLAVFTLALGRGASVVEGVPFTLFLAPGLIMMSMIQNAFANSSSSIVSSKMQGNIVDVLMAPLTPFEQTMGYALGGMTRGLLVGCVVAGAMELFVGLTVHNVAILLFYAVGATLMLSLLGVAGGVWSQKHEQMSMVSNFIITPCAFLSGTFYSIDRLPGLWNLAAHLNPFFYLIDGFRYGLIGLTEGNLAIGAAVVVFANMALWGLCHWMFASGYRLRA
ncbi:MAG TPA: ABC transporter permease [Alphaproteobacteria bacterium]|jgi:ABC-2 type transport system permease protein